MAEFVVHLEDQAELELDNLDVGVEEDVIAFDITGTIRDIDDDLLADLADTTLTPTEVHFALTDD
ncbi:hypothetical protein ACFFQF_32275 [Haladaptatus pallidirubidus]|uniref:Halobacterial output domain-containing protein n=1 Tax=Haladaptatus pallidirubidus TaxID=1008152 RepID=A0AAV3UMY4_9EURY|nr:hypothetical protein [Haladaptatus pallidirubidus]